MPRPSTVLVIFVVSINLFAGAFISMGIMDTVGLHGQVQQDNDVAQSAGEALNGTSNGEYGLGTGTAADGTLFGMYNVLSQQVQGLYATVYPALDMMNRAGVPDQLTFGVLGNIFTFVIIFDVMSYIRGWGL